MQGKQLYRGIQRFLPAFEAAARLKSFTLAADEVGLTQSAISKQIKELEERLGLPLFLRAHKQVSLTPAGEALHRAHVFAISHVMDVLHDLVEERARQHIVLSTSTANAAFLLLPRVAEVRRCFRNGEIFVVTADPQGIEPTGRVDLALTFGKPDHEAFRSRPLFRDILTPVCTPAFLARHGPLASIEDLLACDLLDMQAQHPSWIGWRRWLRTWSLDLPTQHHAMGFNNYYNTIQACLAGQGVALGWLRMLGDHLESGQLVAPLAERIETEEFYHLAWPAYQPAPADSDAFADWLIACFGQGDPTIT